ncbi:6297_t:CDS:1, partial [Ambispora leptoticha]
HSKPVIEAIDPRNTGLSVEAYRPNKDKTITNAKSEEQETRKKK